MSVTGDAAVVHVTRRSKGSWSLAVGILLGVALSWAVVRQVGWRAVGSAIGHVSPVPLLFAIAATVAAQALFAWRWHVMIGRESGMKYRDAFDFLAIGTIAGLVLPPRLSDVARAVAAGRFHAISISGLFGVIVVERLLDVIMLVMFGTLVSALMSTPPAVTASLTTLLALGVLAAIVLWLGARGPAGLVLGWARRRRGASRLTAFADRFLAGTAVIRSPALMLRAFLITLVGWVCVAAGAKLTIIAFAIDAPWYAGAFVTTIINLAGILPSPPAGVGVYHYAVTVGVSPWLDDASRALAFALVSHAMSIAVVTCLGTWSLARKGLSVGTLRRLADSEAAKLPEHG